MTNGQAVMHYTNGVGAPYMTTLTYASTNDQWARPACPLVSSSKTQQCHLSSVHLRRCARE